MEYVIAICGFIGGWLLVAGPVWQAAIELQEEEIDQEAIEAVKSTIEVPPPIALWWWLLPPVAYILQTRRRDQYQKRFNAALAPEQLKQTTSFFNKANGWVIVAIGGFLIAVKETWELVGDFHWPQWVFWILFVVMPLLAVASAVRKTITTYKTLNPDAKRPEKPRRART
jgi:hypothetical protein